MPEYAQFEFVIISFPFIAGQALELIRRARPRLVDFFLDMLLPSFYKNFMHGTTCLPVGVGERADDAVYRPTSQRLTAAKRKAPARAECEPGVPDQ